MLSTRDPKLPEDVMIEILSRLPVKTLLRFKCVSKDWCALIRKPSFVSKHFHQESNHARLLVHHYNSDTERCSGVLFPDETLTGMPPVHEDLEQLNNSDNIHNIVGPINGLFFLHNAWYGWGDRVALWNPATREFRLLPEPHSILPPHFASVTHTIGFGLDPLTNNYKVIWIRFFWDDKTDNPLIPYVVAIYNLGSDSWRYLDPFKPTTCSIENSLGATYVNGGYFWLATGKDDKHWLILFDMSTEVFTEIPGPDHPKQTWGALTMYNESIALFICQTGVPLQSIIDIWLMKEEGRWTKHLTVKPFPEVERPLGFWKNEHIFLESSSLELILYNHDTCEIRNLGMYGDGTEVGIRVFSYKESLVSVKGQNKDWKGYDSSDMFHDFFNFDCPDAREEHECYPFISHLLNCIRGFWRSNSV